MDFRGGRPEQYLPALRAPTDGGGPDRDSVRWGKTPKHLRAAWEQGYYYRGSPLLTMTNVPTSMENAAAFALEAALGLGRAHGGVLALSQTNQAVADCCEVIRLHDRGACVGCGLKSGHFAGDQACTEATLEVHKLPLHSQRNKRKLVALTASEPLRQGPQEQQPQPAGPSTGQPHAAPPAQLGPPPQPRMQPHPPLTPKAPAPAEQLQAPLVAPTAPAPVAKAPVAAVAVAVVAAASTPADRFEAKLAAMRDKDIEGSWVKLAPYLRELGLKDRHTVRYVTPSEDWDCWTSSSGQPPVQGVHWDYRSGWRGGGDACSGGPIYCRKSFLRAVYIREYSNLQ
jgi:hypothetical protein